MKTIHQLIEEQKETVIAHRRYIHQHPEVSGEEKNTAAYVAEELRKIGINPTTGVGGYGVVGLIEGAGPGRCVGLRADMDALTITETTGRPFASVNEGVSHACGHDCHTAMLLGAARILYNLRDTFTGSVKLVFQPSEENSADSGAKKMIEAGLLQNPKVDIMIGQHVRPDNPTGVIALREGAMSAASDRFFIDIIGKSCHGSSPHQGIDAVVISAEVILSLQSIVSRMVNPFDNSVITIGKINGGDRYNITPGFVHMEGTCRNTNPEVRMAVAARIEETVRSITHLHGADYQFRFVQGFPPVQNDSIQAKMVMEVAKEILGDEGVVNLKNPTMGGEDFSFYSLQVPSAFYWLGCCPEGTENAAPLHNGSFDPDEKALAIGCEVMVSAALKALKS